jgi:hypothetical protein
VSWEALKVTLVTAVERIRGHRTVGVDCTQPNPFPHRQVSSAWVQAEVVVNRTVRLHHHLVNNGYDSRARNLATEHSFRRVSS